MSCTSGSVHLAGLESIDVVHRQVSTDPTSRTPARIVHYSLSGDGNYVATLSVRNKTLHLDIWKLGQEGVTSYGHRETPMRDTVLFSKSM